MSKRKPHPNKVFHYPKESGDYNFVQLLIDFRELGYREYPMLIFPDNEKTHGEILEKFLEEMNFHYPRFNNGKKGIPNLIGKDYCVVGLGKGYFNKDETILEVGKIDSNNDYGSAGLEVGINREHFNEIAKHSKIIIRHRE